jgi:hypothetical protein
MPVTILSNLYTLSHLISLYRLRKAPAITFLLMRKQINVKQPAQGCTTMKKALLTVYKAFGLLLYKEYKTNDSDSL